MTNTLTEVPLSKLRPRPENLRIDANGDDLVDSIRTFGVMQPLNVSPDGDSGFYLINAGHRRYDAAKKAGVKNVPVMIRNGDSAVDDATITAMMLVENLQRADLDVVEQALGFKRLFDLGWKQKEIADKTGFHASVISRRIKIAGLPDEVLEKLRVGDLPLEVAENLVPLAELDADAAVELADGTYPPNTYIIERAVAQAKLAQVAEKLGAKVEAGGYAWVPPEQITNQWVLDEGSKFRWEIIYVEVEHIDEDDEVYTRRQPQTVGTGPIELAAAWETEGVAAFSVANVDKKAQLVCVRKVTEEAKVDPATGLMQTDDQAARAKEREQRAAERAKAAHELEQFQLMVAGKVNKTDVIDWMIPVFFDAVHEESKKKACQYLQLEPVLRAKKVWKDGAYVDDPGKTEKDWRATFDAAVEEAQGVSLMRIVLAVVLAQGPGYTEERKAQFATIKEQLGFEEFVAADE